MLFAPRVFRSLNVNKNMEYTLEDAFETLKDAQAERRKEIEDLINVISNNDPVAFNKSCSPEDVRTKQHKLCKNLVNQVVREEPKYYPVPKTSDLHVQVIGELEEETRNAQRLLDKMMSNLSDVNEDISYLRKKKTGLQKMREAYLGAAEMIANTSYNKEHVTTKCMFQRVKRDLHMVVDKLFPENQHFKEFLAELTTAYTRGGDDLYVEIGPEVLDFANFLIEADIAMYHRNDKSKVRLTDML